MHKTRAWQIWWENDPDAQRFRRLSVSMCSHGVNIAELTREAFLAGVGMRPYIMEGQKTAINTRSPKRAKCLHYNTTVDGSLCNDCHKKLR